MMHWLHSTASLFITLTFSSFLRSNFNFEHTQSVSVSLILFHLIVSSIHVASSTVTAVGGPQNAKKEKKMGNENWKHIYYNYIHLICLMLFIRSRPKAKNHHHQHTHHFCTYFPSLFVLLFGFHQFPSSVWRCSLTPTIWHTFLVFFSFCFVRISFYTYLLCARIIIIIIFDFHSKWNVYQSHSRILFERFKMCFESEVVNVLAEHCSHLIEVLLMCSHHRDDVSRFVLFRSSAIRFEHERSEGGG